MARDTKERRQNSIFVKVTVILTLLLVILEICFALLLFRYLKTEEKLETVSAQLEQLRQEQSEAEQQAEMVSQVQARKVTDPRMEAEKDMQAVSQTDSGLQTQPDSQAGTDAAQPNSQAATDEAAQTEADAAFPAQTQTGSQEETQSVSRIVNVDENTSVDVNTDGNVWEAGNCEAGTIVTPEEIAGAEPEAMFQSRPIVVGDEVYSRIYGNSYVENYDISLEQLRYLKVVHYNFNHELQIGELIVNAGLEQDYLEIFEELYEAEYEIESLYLIDNYWTGEGSSSDTASIEQNNSSAFCYRAVTGGGSLSKHALGCAIDINPQQNPYVTFDGYGNPSWTHQNANDYINRDSGLPHVITYSDDCYRIFTEHGFEWGGDWNNPKDYQHFQKTVY